MLPGEWGVLHGEWVVLPGGCVLPKGGCAFWGEYFPGGGGVLPGGVVVSQHALRQTHPVNRMPDRCKNITLPQTSFAGGKDPHQIQWEQILLFLYISFVHNFNYRK